MGGQSIRTKILKIIIILVLPLNVLYLASIASSIAIVKTQVENSLGSLAKMSVAALDQRVQNTNYFFFSLLDGDENFIKLSRQRFDNSYILARAAVSQMFYDNISYNSMADGLYFHARETDDLYLALPNRFTESMNNIDLLKYRCRARQYLLDNPPDEMARGILLTIDGFPWIVKVGRQGAFEYGALYSLDALREGILRASEYEGLEITFNARSAPRASIHASATSSGAQLTVRLSVPSWTVVRFLSIFQIVGAFAAIAYFLLAPVLLATLDRYLLRPLNKINSALERLAGGDNAYRISQHRYADEFRRINQNFNRMADSIQTLKIENYEKELARRKMELSNLQLQMRPHFLLNCFNLAHGLAGIRDYENIQKLSVFLSDYFRYIVRGESALKPLRDELELIRRYLEVSSVRYPGYFECAWDVDPGVLDEEIPPLLVHNLVENVIRHALKYGRVTHIALCARREGGFLTISVKDDGAGMPEETRDEINAGRFGADAQTHIGMANTLQRIRFFFGETSGLRVESRPGEGARVEVRLDLSRRKEALS